MSLWTEIYDPVSNTLSQTGDMNVARTQHAASVLPDGRVLLTGGRPSNPTAAETYDHLTGLWTLLPPIPAGLVAHSSTVLPHGEVLLVGGCTIPPPPPLYSFPLAIPTTTADRVSSAARTILQPFYPMDAF